MIKTFFKIIPKKRKRGRPLKPKNPELSPNDNQQYLEPPARKRQQIENVDWITAAMNWSFVKEALEFCRDNRNGTAIDRGMMSAEAECIPRSTIYSIENCVGDNAFTRHHCFKEREMLLDSWNQKCIQDMIVNRDWMSTGMNQSEVGKK